MIVQRTCAVLSHQEQVKAAPRALKHMIARHGGMNLRYFAPINFDTSARLLMCEIDGYRHCDSLNADPEFWAVRFATPARRQNRLGRGRGAPSRGEMCDRDSEDQQ